MKYINYVVGAFAAVSLFSCSNFLDEVPDQRAKVDTYEKAKDLLVYAYPSASYMYFTEAMTDNFSDSRRTQNTSLDNTAYYTWDVEKQESWDSPAEYWDACYKAISQANQALAAIEEIDASEAKKNEIRGEAFIARAYAHFMLANIFCEAYNPNTADSNMGIPYVDEVEDILIKDYERGTLRETYDKIEKDIEEGIKLIGDNYKQPMYHFNKTSARAFASKFYTYVGKWDKVIEYSDALGDFPQGKLRNYAEGTSLSFDGESQLYASAQQQANLLIAGTRSLLNRQYGTIRFGWTLDKALDLRDGMNPLKKRYNWRIIWQSQDVYFLLKFYEYFVFENQSAGIGQPYVNTVLLTNDEWYLNRIEATIMHNDLDKAAKMMAHFAIPKTLGYVEGDENKVTLNSVLGQVADASEIQPFYELTEDQRKMLKYVSELRRRDAVLEGARWFDIKRYYIEVTHPFLIEGTEDVLTSDDQRRVVQLPTSAISAGLTPNPR